MTIAATPHVPNTPATMLQRSVAPTASGRRRVSRPAPPASTNAVTRCDTTGQVPDDSSVETERMNMSAKNTPEPAPSITPARIEACCSEPGTHDVRNSAATPTVTPAQPSAPGTSPRAVS